MYMEDDIESPTSSILPIALAIFAILLGGAGLYFGLTANQRLTEVSAILESGGATVAKAEKQMSTYEAKIVELEAMVNTQRKTVDRLRVDVAQSKKVVKTLNSEVKINRKQIVQNADGMKKLASSGVVLPKPASKAKVSSQKEDLKTGSEEMTPVTEVSAGVYQIEPGDTLAGIALKKGVKLQVLLDANPDVDPRRLAIGQQINIPVE